MTTEDLVELAEIFARQRKLASLSTVMEGLRRRLSPEEFSALQRWLENPSDISDIDDWDDM